MTQSPVSNPRPPLARLAEIIQTILTGLILAFIFRAFFVEPFIIPTGSMATTLLGAHALRICPACGWEFAFAPLPSGDHDTTFLVPPELACPNCLARIPATPEDTVPRAGDRILVHKWPLALGRLFPPKPWDVIVFRDPVDPEQHYIKRIVGRPHESVEIVGGDLFINGTILRKPPYVQAALWIIVFDQAHYPQPQAPSAHNPRWITLDPPISAPPPWTGLDSRILSFNDASGTPHSIEFNADAAHEYLVDFHAHNRGSTSTFAGDLRLRADVQFHTSSGMLEWTLDRPPYHFTLRIEPAGTLTLTGALTDPEALAPASDASAIRTLNLTAQVGRFHPGRPRELRLELVDYEIRACVDGRIVLRAADIDEFPFPPALEYIRNRPLRVPASIRISAAGTRLDLSRFRIERDVVYVAHGRHNLRASPGTPFHLGENEYFVLGDNSADSFDSREWTAAGPHLPPHYRPGTVLAGQIVGQAAFVYLPGLLPLDRAGRWFVPDLGRVRFVR